MTESTAAALPHVSGGWYRLLHTGAAPWLETGPFDCVSCATGSLRRWVADGGKAELYNVRLAGPFTSEEAAHAADVSETLPARERDFAVSVRVTAPKYAPPRRLRVRAYDAGAACAIAAHQVAGTALHATGGHGYGSATAADWVMILGGQTIAAVARPAD